MNVFQLELYKPSDLELWICQVYRENGIHYAADMDIERIAEIFGFAIQMTRRDSQAVFDDDGDCIFYLHAYACEEDRRADFFHELCHPLRHVGSQRTLPDLFVDLQETQAAQFQLIAAMPSFMFKEFKPYYHMATFPKIAAEAFNLPLELVTRRIQQMMGRIRQEREDRELRARFAPRKAGSYMPLTVEALARLEEMQRRRKAMGG